MSAYSDNSAHINVHADDVIIGGATPSEAMEYVARWLYCCLSSLLASRRADSTANEILATHSAFKRRCC